MLSQEDINESEMGFSMYDTYIMTADNNILGFFTLKTEWGYPSLLHFCVDRKYRSPKVSRELLKELKRIIRDKGFTEMILHSKKSYLDRCIQYYFKKKPYAVTNDLTTYYFITI